MRRAVPVNVYGFYRECGNRYSLLVGVIEHIHLVVVFLSADLKQPIYIIHRKTTESGLIVGKIVSRQGRIDISRQVITYP